VLLCRGQAGPLIRETKTRMGQGSFAIRTKCCDTHNGVQSLVDVGVDGHQEKVQFIWSVAELLRGPYRPWEYGGVILPFTVLRRLDCALAATKDAVLAKAATISDDLDPVVRDRVLASAAGGRVYNLSRFTFPRLIADPDGLVRNLNDLVNGYPHDLRDVFIEHFKLPEQVERLRSVDRLYQVVQRFGEIDLHPDRVPNIAMGYIFEELIRRFSEARDEKAGDHFTPREVVRLMVDLLFYEDHEVLTQRGIVRTVFDPACGTGGMLASPKTTCVSSTRRRPSSPTARTGTARATRSASLTC
jgi:type I restriction enzyme M protein